VSEVPFSGFEGRVCGPAAVDLLLVEGRDFVTYIDLVGVRVGNHRGFSSDG
jgi:hypothetical protein